MKNFLGFGIAATAALVGGLAFVSPVLAQSEGSICIDGAYLVSTEQRVIEVFDVNANTHRGSYTMRGGERTYGIPAQVNGSGYVNVRYRNVTNNGSWIGASLLKSGDCIKP